MYTAVYKSGPKNGIAVHVAENHQSMDWHRSTVRVVRSQCEGTGSNASCSIRQSTTSMTEHTGQG